MNDAPSPGHGGRGTRTVRLALAATGLALLGWGGWLLLYQTRDGTVVQVARWLVGAVVLHDAVMAPLVLSVGWLLSRLSPPWARGVLRGGLTVAGCLTLLALPLLLRPGPPANPSVLPLDYPRNWALALTVVAVTTAVLLLARWPRWRRLTDRTRGTRLRGRRTPRRPTRRSAPPDG